MSNHLNKFLKILLGIEFILILAIIALALIDNKRIPTGYAVKEIPAEEKSDFKILTKAVCEEKSEHILCRDELFARCNGKEYLISQDSLGNFIECNNIKLNLSDVKVNGSVKFKKN